MKSYLFGLLLLLSCGTLFAQIETILSEADFLNSVEKSFDLRKRSLEFYQATHHKFSKQVSLTHKELETIHNLGIEYVLNRAELYKYIQRGTDFIGKKDVIYLDPEDETYSTYGLMYFREYHYINPLDPEGIKKLKEIKMAVVAGLILYDNYLSVVNPYIQHTKIRNSLKRTYPEYKGKLNEIVSNFLSMSQRKLFIKGLDIYEQEKELIEEGKIVPDSLTQYLDHLLEESATMDYLAERGVFDVRASLGYAVEKVLSTLRLSVGGTTFVTSKIFGNLMGMVQTRSGHMKDFSTEQIQNIADKLAPLDILFEKTPFRLTDSFIPGYYGHVAIWVGTEKELKDLGVWDHPSVMPYHESIRSGHNIIEALRPGVVINTLQHFLDIDDFLAIRPTTLSNEDKKSYLIRAFSQLGKKYDFSFDVEDDKQIVCSEIAYVVYHHVQWPTDKTLGRFTISPDHVAWEAVPGKSFTPVVMFKDGVEVKENIEAEFLANLTGPQGIKQEE